MTVSVILSTYNSPQWLRKAIWGWGAQTDRDFELVIADDGSTNETRQTIEELRQDIGLTIRHVWHEDRGFRKCEILNQAIVASAGEYLIFSDGDCIPRPDFVQTHRALARPGRFLSGRCLRLPPETSAAITREEIVSGRCADPRWLREHGFAFGRKLLTLRARGRVAAALDNLTRRHVWWLGANASGWREHVLAVNGFNEQLGYMEEDREFGLRLDNLGVRGIYLRHRAITLHLDHGRTYADPAIRQANFAVCRQVAREKITWAEQGIVKPSPESRSTIND